MNYVVELTKKELQLLIRGLREVSQKKPTLEFIACPALIWKLNLIRYHAKNMTINKVAALKAGDSILVGDQVYTVTGTHQTGIHDLDVYVKSELDRYEKKLALCAGDRVCVLGR